jgi:hypothetical protein
MRADDPFLLLTTNRGYAAGEPRPFLWKDGTTASSAELLLGTVLVGLSLLGAWFVIKTWSDARALDRDPVLVQGKVSQMWVTGGKKGRTYHVLCEYDVATGSGPLTVRREVHLRETPFYQLQTDGPITVKYCRSNPANYRVEGQVPGWPFDDGRAVLFALAVLACVAVVGCINLWAWWAWRRPPRAGTPVVILYLNDRNHTML